MTTLRQLIALLRRIHRWLFPTPAELWDLHARQLRREGYGDHEILELMGTRSDDQVMSEPGVAECIAQLDAWNGRLEAAIDRQAHAQLGQHPNDDAPLEHLP